jgi:hypothetical protein
MIDCREPIWILFENLWVRQASFGKLFGHCETLVVTGC